MLQTIYERVKSGVSDVDHLFEERFDCTGLKSATSNRKLAGALLHLSLGIHADELVEWIRNSESLIAKSGLFFWKRCCQQV